MRHKNIAAVAVCLAWVAGCGSSGGKVATGQPSAIAKPSGFSKETYRLVSEPDEVVSVLDNGLTVIAKRVSSPVLTVRGYCRTGSAYEGKWLGGGLSHLLEHLVAGGTVERRTEAENRDILQELGNDSNAFTTDDVTAFFVNTTPDHLDKATDLLTGWVFGAKITPAEYRREYEVVQRELEKDKGEPDMEFYDLSRKTRYRVSPAGVPVIGYQEVIRGLSRDDVYEYYKMAYVPQNMVLAVAGDLDPEVMLHSVQKYVDDVKPGRVFSHDVADEPRVTVPHSVVATFPKLGQARVQIEYPTVTLHDPDLFALDLLSTILGGGESAILTEELRDKQQIVSEVGTGSNTPAYVEGGFQVSMQVPPEKVNEAIRAAKEQLKAIKEGEISSERIARAKTQMKASRVKQLTTAESVAESLAMDFINTGDPHFTDQYIKRIGEVTAGQLRAVARKYFDDGRVITTVMLPAEYAGAQGLPRAVDLVRPTSPTTAIAETGGTASDVRRTVLSNGTILLTKRIPTAPVVSIQMYALGGVTAEDAKTNGLGNLAMEMVTRGTTTRSATQIAELFESLGADVGAACGNNSWSWTAGCLKDDFPKVVEAYADVVNNASFPEDELSLMKKRVAAEIESEDADWTQQAFRFFKKQYYGPLGSPYQFLPIGTQENVASFSRKQVADWYRTKVRRAKRVLAIYGDVDPKQAEGLAEKYLGKGEKLADAPAVESRAVVLAPDTSKPVIRVERVEVQKTDQPLAGVVIGFHSNSVVGEPANFPIAVGDTMCSGYTYPTGYLFETLRGRGLVYVVHAQNVPGRDASLPGTFMAYAGCDPGRVNDVVDLMLENIARLQGTPEEMQPTWFTRSKQLINTTEAMNNETPSQQASTAAVDELLGLGYDYHKSFADRVNRVKLDEVRLTAHQRIWSCVVTVSTPDPKAVATKAGQRTYGSFPPVDLTPRGVQHDTGAGK